MPICTMNIRLSPERHAYIDHHHNPELFDIQAPVRLCLFLTFPMLRRLHPAALAGS